MKLRGAIEACLSREERQKSESEMEKSTLFSLIKVIKSGNSMKMKSGFLVDKQKLFLFVQNLVVQN